LHTVTERDANNNGQNFTIVYDGLGRRLQTTEFVVSNGVASSTPIVVSHYFDPMYEFQELGLTEGSQTINKLMGPDSDGNYGGENGTGGFDAISPYLNLFDPTIADVNGDILGYYDPTKGSVQWNSSRVTAYGAVPDYRPPTLGSSGSVASQYAWRDRATESIGLTWLGGNWYDPVSGQFMSPDPLGNGANVSLYDFCSGNPLTYWDADGRMGKNYLEFQYNGGMTGFGLRTIGNYLSDYTTANPTLAWLTGFSGNLVNVAAGANAPSSYVNGIAGFGRNVSTIYHDSGFLPAASYSISGWNVGKVWANGIDNIDLVTGQPVGDGYARWTAVSSGVANTAGIAAGGLWGATRLGVVPATSSAGAASSLWQNRFPGVQVRQVGNYWVKRVNPNSPSLMQAWGQQTIQAQAESLQTLRAAGVDAANSRLFDSGRLVVENVGTPMSRLNYFNPQLWRNYVQNSRALGTPFNDLWQPGNYGQGFRPFDPALDPYQAGIGIGGGIIVGGGIGYGIYSGIYNSGGGQ
jgi:RHS repeat-associated protein